MALFARDMICATSLREKWSAEGTLSPRVTQRHSVRNSSARGRLSMILSAAFTIVSRARPIQQNCAIAYSCCIRTFTFIQLFTGSPCISLLRLVRTENESSLSFSPSEDAKQVKYPAACRGEGCAKHILQRGLPRGMNTLYCIPVLRALPAHAGQARQAGGASTACLFWLFFVFSHSMISLAVKERGDKENVRELRRFGRIPAVMYGRDDRATSISIETRRFEKVWKNAGESTIISLIGASD